MKFNKKIMIIIFNIIVLNIVNQCFASTDNNIVYSKDGVNYIDKIYSIEQSNKENFFSKLENEIIIDNTKYVYENKKIENQDTIESKEINTVKTFILNTNNKEKIIESLGKTIEYNENGFIGTYILDENSINIETHNNRYYDKLIDKTVEYKELPKNDLYYIPKQISYNNKILGLLSTKWEITENEKIGNATVGSQYKAICYYATKERVYRPNTYTITAKYTGIAQKEIDKPLKITISYKEKIETEPMKDDNNNSIVAIISGTSGIIVFLGGIFIFTRNVKVYNYQNGKWVYLGKTIILNNKIKLNIFKNKEITNKYRIKLGKNLTQKYNDKLIIIVKGANQVNKIVHTNDKIIDFEIII